MGHLYVARCVCGFVGRFRRDLHRAESEAWRHEHDNDKGRVLVGDLIED